MLQSNISRLTMVLLHGVIAMKYQGGSKGSVKRFLLVGGHVAENIYANTFMLQCNFSLTNNVTLGRCHCSELLEQTEGV